MGGLGRDGASQKKRVLLVDDSPAILSFIRAYMVRLDCDYLEAHDADRALRLANLMVVNLVIADINMPGTDGIEFVKKLRASDNERLRLLPVILMTGDRDPHIRERGLAAGAQGFLTKPVDGTALVTSVARLLHGEDT